MDRISCTLLSIALASACTKKDKADCDAYADRVASLGSPERAGSVRFAAHEACESGEMPASEIRCVIAASSHDESLRCHGIGGGSAPVPPKPTEPPKPTAPLGPRARHLGLSVAIPQGWTDDTSSDSIAFMSLQLDQTHGVGIMRAEKSMLKDFNPIASEEACRSSGDKNKGSEMTTVEPNKLVETPQGKACRGRLKTATESVITETFFAANGDAISFTCVFVSQEAEPPPGCKVIRDSLTLD